MKRLIIFLLIPLQAFCQRQNLLLEATFEGNNAFVGFSLAGHQYCCSYSITQVINPEGPGKVLKYDLRRTDTIVSSSVRAEIELQGTDAPENSERWYGLQYYLQNYGADPGAESLLQWHDINGTCPPLSLQVQSGRLRIQQCINNANTSNDLGPVVSNAWLSIVMHVKWTSGNTGIIQVWRDGQLMVNKSNIRTNSTGGSYFKFGINKWSWAPGGGSSNQSQRIFYVDNFRMGNDNAMYQDVSPDAIIVTPVSWGYFRYNDLINSLEWSTESEQNNDHFEVEESLDGSAWNTIASISTKAIDGNSASSLIYSYAL
jgi:hypothetical protein